MKIKRNYLLEVVGHCASEPVVGVHEGGLEFRAARAHSSIKIDIYKKSRLFIYSTNIPGKIGRIEFSRFLIFCSTKQHITLLFSLQ